MKHLVFDTETSDLISNSARALDKQPRVFELAGILWNDADNTEALHHWQINPATPISKIATQKTGVTNAMCAGRPLFSQVAPAIKEMIEQADVAVAHNLAFDRAMLNYEFFRIRDLVTWPKRGVCTVEYTEHLLGMRLALNDLHQHLFNFGFSGAHGAVADAQATLRCYRELLKRGEI